MTQVPQATHAQRLSEGRAPAPFRMLCLPFAGGRADAYRRWGREFDGLAEVWGVDLPGRYSRAGEPMVVDVPTAVDDLAAEATALLDRPLILFGHSMGGWLAFEVALRLESAGRAVALVVISGTRGVYDPRLQEMGGTLDDDLLVAKLRQWGGVQPVLLEEPEVLGALLPTLRADLLLGGQYHGPAARLDAPVMALAGADDPTAPPPSAARWADCSLNWRGLTVVPGDHFFLFSNEALVLKMLRGAMLYHAAR
jgi:pyochelin biosynthetic protein PchC